MQGPTRKMDEIDRLLSAVHTDATDPEQSLRNFLLAVDDYPADDVEQAVTHLVKGIAPGVNPAYPLRPPQLGAECRRVMHLRLDSERRAKPYAALPPPAVSEAERDRVGAGLKQLASDLGETVRNAEAARAAKRREDYEADTRRRVGTGEFVEPAGATVPVSRTLIDNLGVILPGSEREVA